MKTLRELILTDEAAAMEILRAIAKGENIQWCDPSHNSWHVQLNTKIVQFDLIYRIAPQPSTVDWSQVGEEIVVFATDGDGLSFGYVVGPVAIPNKGWRSEKRCHPATLWSSFKPGNMPWRESMIIRPGKETL